MSVRLSVCDEEYCSDFVDMLRRLINCRVIIIIIIIVTFMGAQGRCRGWKHGKSGVRTSPLFENMGLVIRSNL